MSIPTDDGSKEPKQKRSFKTTKSVNMKTKLLSSVELFRGMRKSMPPPTKAFAVNKGRGGYDRKRFRQQLKKEFE